MTDQLEPQLEEEIPQELEDAFRPSTETPEPPEEPEAPPTETPPSEPQEPSGDTTSAAYQRLQRLLEANPDLADHIGAWERGEAVLVPRQTVEQWQQPQQPVQAQPEPETPGFYDDPEGYVKRLEETVQTLHQTFTAREQQSYQQALSRNENIFNTFVSDFRSKHPELTDDQFKELQDEVTLSGRVKRGVDSHGDPNRALRDAFDREYRAMYPSPTNEDMLKAQRQKRRAGAAASSPRPAQRGAPPEAPKTKQERIQAGADFLREHLEANA